MYSLIKWLHIVQLIMHEILQQIKLYVEVDFILGSPFKIPIGEPPDPRKVHVYGPGIEDGILHSYQSRFLVETSGAGAGQLAVRIKGPRG